MLGIPQEIRVSSMTISFIDNAKTVSVATSVIVTGAVITIDGNVHKFSFERGRLCFGNKQSVTKPFDKTTQQRLEHLLISYIHGALKLNVIPYNINDDCINTCIAELEE